jgi:hypothetical protein
LTRSIETFLLIELLEQWLGEIRVTRSRRTPSRIRQKRRRYYRRHKSRIKRKQKRYRRRPRTKRFAKRRAKIRKRLHLRPGSRRRIHLVTSTGGTMDTLSELKELNKALSQDKKIDLLSGFKKAKALAEALDKKYGKALAEANTQMLNKPLNETTVVAEPTEEDFDFDPLTLLPEGEVEKNLPFNFRKDNSFIDEEFTGMFAPKKKLEEAVQIVKSDLGNLAQDADKMAVYVSIGAVNEEEANEILVRMVEYLDKAMEKTEGLEISEDETMPYSGDDKTKKADFAGQGDLGDLGEVKWTGSGSEDKTFQPGTIFKRKSRKGGEDSFALIVGTSRHGSGFYYVPCDESGNIDSDADTWSSNMLLGDEIEKAGTKKLEKKTSHGLTWYLTGNENIDNGKLANLDNRSQLFLDLAPEKLQKKYDRQEDRNYHRENAEMVAAFAEHVLKGGTPETFKEDVSTPAATSQMGMNNTGPGATGRSQIGVNGEGVDETFSSVDGTVYETSKDKVMAFIEKELMDLDVPKDSEAWKIVFDSAMESSEIMGMSELKKYIEDYIEVLPNNLFGESFNRTEEGVEEGVETVVLDEADPSLAPPKKWFDKMYKGIHKENPSYSDEQATKTVGDIWYHNLSTKKRKEIRGREGKKYAPAEDVTQNSIMNLGTGIKESVQPLDEKKLSSKERNKLPDSAFALPKERKYPIHNITHAKNALARSSGKPEEKRVKAAVYKKYPSLKESIDESISELKSIAAALSESPKAKYSRDVMGLIQEYQDGDIDLSELGGKLYEVGDMDHHGTYGAWEGAVGEAQDEWAKENGYEWKNGAYVDDEGESHEFEGPSGTNDWSELYDKFAEKILAGAGIKEATDAPIEEAVSDSEKEKFMSAEVTLNGKRAKISGRKNKFATVSQLPDGESYDWSWDAVARIVKSGGKFKSGSGEKKEGVAEDGATFCNDQEAYCDQETHNVTEKEEDERQEDDAVMSDSGKLGAMTSLSYNGKFVGEFDSQDEAEEALAQLIKKDKFYPNVWYVDDHGGDHLLSKEFYKKYKMESVQENVTEATVKEPRTKADVLHLADELSALKDSLEWREDDAGNIEVTYRDKVMAKVPKPWADMFLDLIGWQPESVVPSLEGTFDPLANEDAYSNRESARKVKLAADDILYKRTGMEQAVKKHHLDDKDKERLLNMLSSMQGKNA